MDLVAGDGVDMVGMMVGDGYWWLVKKNETGARNM